MFFLYMQLINFKDSFFCVINKMKRAGECSGIEISARKSTKWVSVWESRGRERETGKEREGEREREGEIVRERVRESERE